MVDFNAIQSYVRTSVRTWRECQMVGPFLVSFNRSSSNPTSITRYQNTVLHPPMRTYVH
jgi:hypothetical protein